MPAPATLTDLEWELMLNAVTAGLASFAGAYGAWKISSRAEQRRRIGDEIILANAAMSLCVSLANNVLALKSQNVERLAEDYHERFLRYSAVVERVTRGLPFQMLEMGANLQHTSMPFLPLEDLREAVRRVLHCRAGQPLFAQISLSVRGLAEVTERRNRVADAILDARVGDPEREARYFGIFGVAICDESYPDAMTGLVARVDDCIYFPLLLADVLSRHATSLNRDFGPGAPKAATFEITEGFQQFVPPASEYPSFEKQFRVTPDTARYGLGVRIWRAVCAAVLAFRQALKV
jgi:hypothetical protein